MNPAGTQHQAEDQAQRWSALLVAALSSFLTPFMLSSVNIALFSSPNMNAIMSSVEKRYYGVASGSVATMRLLGQMLSLGIVTLVFALVIGRVQITPELHPDFLASVCYALFIFFGLCLFGIYFSFSRGSLRGGGDEGSSQRAVKMDSGS